MSLFSRITAPSENRMPVLVLKAYLNEITRGQVTRGGLDTELGLTAGEITELGDLIGRGLTTDEIIDIFIIAEYAGVARYGTENGLRTRLGLPTV